MEIQIRTPGGEVTWLVPVMKMHNYQIDEIFEKDLLFLIPFYIFNFEKQFTEMEQNPDKLEVLQKEFLRIRHRLDQLSAEEAEVAQLIMNFDKFIG